MSIEQLLDQAALLLALDLGIDVPEVRMLKNHEEGVFGKVFEHIPNVVFIDIPQIEKKYETNLAINIAIVKTLCHEIRHIWQDENNWSYEWDMPYELRPSEIDADNYAESMYVNLVNELFKEIA